jgi:hypothetical protein
MPALCRTPDHFEKKRRSATLSDANSRDMGLFREKASFTATERRFFAE